MGDVETLTLRQVLNFLMARVSGVTAACKELQDLTFYTRDIGRGPWIPMSKAEEVVTVLAAHYEMIRGEKQLAIASKQVRSRRMCNPPLADLQRVGVSACWKPTALTHKLVGSRLGLLRAPCWVANAKCRASGFLMSV